jgi:hypothetical protein
MKVIAIGDPHFRTDNIPEVELFIDKLEELVKNENPDFIVILGDVLHTHERLHTIPLNKAYEFVNRMRNISKTFVLVGNHDYTANCQFLTENHWMNGMKEWSNVTIVDKVIHYDISNYKFVLCPYVPPKRFEEALNTSDGWKNATCIFAHQEFQGCKMGAIVSVDGDHWSESYPPVVSGHIHSKQTLKNVYYCGSSMQHAFGESEKNIIPIFTWENHKSSYHLNEVDLELPRKKIVYTDVEGVGEYKLPETEDKIKITVSGVYEEFKAFKKTKKYRELVSKGAKVVFKPKKLKEFDKEEKKEETVKNEITTENDFNNILLNLVNKEKNVHLYQIYQQVINDKNVNEEDILFL